MTVSSSRHAAVIATDAGPLLVAGRHRRALCSDASTWGTTASRFGPFDELEIDGGLDTVARPDLGLHGLVETLPPGGIVRLMLPNVAFADRVVGLIHGQWTETGVHRCFTRESASELARACGLTVHTVDDHPGSPSDRSTRLLGDRADSASSFTLRCERTHRHTIPVPTLFEPAGSGVDTVHGGVIDLLDGYRRVIAVAPRPTVTDQLVEAGHRVTVVDPTVPSASRRWAERMIVAEPGVDEWTPSIGSAADAVVLGDLLERVVDPVATLVHAAGCLDASATIEPRLVVSVSNVAHADVRIALAAGRWDYGDGGPLARTHLHCFTADRLAGVADAAGLDLADRRTTRQPRDTRVDAGSSPALRGVVDVVDADPDADVESVIWALRRR